MASLNQVMIIGYLGADPELRYTQGGIAIASMRIATSESWKDKQTGERQERTEWHTCTAFGRTAEVVGEYLKKGAQVYIDGHLRTEEYEKDGIKRWATKIIVNQMKMLGKKEGGPSGGSSGNRSSNQSGQRSGQTPQQQSDSSFDDDEIPF